jgi:crotonobetainyl-CoA:carnitine CoA-transferase CaiB-like acyl-CoA transferase
LNGGFELRSILFESVNDYLDFLQHSRAVASNAVQWIDHPAIGRISIPNIPGVAPAGDGEVWAQATRLGEHTVEIVMALGLEPDEVDALREANVISGVS